MTSVPSHCTNKVLDAASGETSVDSGGPCGTAVSSSPCGNGTIDSGEVCDDGVNDSVLCSSSCSSAPDAAVIRADGERYRLCGFSTTVTSDINFCDVDFDGGGGNLNDRVMSAHLTHL